jgi:hypothetical protein
MYTSTEISGSAAVGYSSGTAIKVIQKAAEKLPEDMILTGQVYLLMRYHKGIKPFGYFLSVWVLCGLQHNTKVLFCPYP